MQPFARCLFQSLHRPAAILPAAELQTHLAEESLRTKYIPRQSRDHINKAPSRVPFCLGKMVRSDRLECRRKLGIKEKSRLQPSAWWEGRSVWIGKGVPDNPQKAGSAAEALRGRLQPGSRSKRDFLRKRRNGAQSFPMWDRRSVQIGWDAGANFGQKKRAGARLGSRPLPGAADGGRTRTVSLPRDFKSRVSANFTTAADTSIQ